MGSKAIGKTRGGQGASGVAGSRKRQEASSRPSDLEAQIDQSVLALEAGLARNDLDAFYSVFRSTDLPFLAVFHDGDALSLALACCKVLHRLGGISPAVALAIENQLCVTCTVATFRVPDPDFETRRQSWLRLMQDGRYLIANSHSRVYSDKLATRGVTARREGDRFRVTGTAAYMSLATQSDLVAFLTVIEGEGPAIFVTRLRNNPGIEIGPFLFPRDMQDSDTRRITFHDLAVSEDEMFIGGKTELLSQFYRFEMIWHEILMPALYLGAAARAIEEARRFLLSVRGHDDRPLAELDGMIVDMGRMVIRYKSAWALVRQTCERLGEVARSPLEKGSLLDLFELAGTTKYTCTIAAEELVTAARHIIGARSYTGNDPNPIERLSHEIAFAPLGQEVNAVIERQIGKRALQDVPFHHRLD